MSIDNRKLLVTLFLSVILSHCAYYNILFNAEERYASGLKQIEMSHDGKITPAIRKDFYTAIDKCWKLINLYSDSSKYADDALLMIGKSHFHVEEYTKSERYLRQFIDRYNDSELLVEAQLWLGRALLEEGKNDKALEYLNKVLAAEADDESTAQAYLSIGQIYFNMEAYDLTRTQLKQIKNYTTDDQLEARAQYLIARTYFDIGEYENAAKEFQKVEDFDASADLHFEAIIKKVECLIKMHKYEQAIVTLQEASGEGKFLPRKSVLLAKIGDIHRIQEKFEDAAEIYSEIIWDYPRTEGSANSFFGLAQLMEFAYSDLDSAKSLYLQVGREFRESELKESAANRANILDQYQKITDRIKQDISDLNEVIAAEEMKQDTEADTTGQESQVTDQNQAAPKKLRGREEIRQSLSKNRFALAEFFLLTMSNYDSAEASYLEFISSTTDTSLIPKALYALHYIYLYGMKDKMKADSVKQMILYEYPTTSYAAYFQEDTKTEADSTDAISAYKLTYLQAESLMFNQQYPQAIEFFTQIAIEDSGSVLAQKARYATAWIYEKQLNDIEAAIKAYSTLVKEYPNTTYGKIAKNKIKKPVVEAETEQENEGNVINPPDSLNHSAGKEIFPQPNE